ncbi:hypothetical protein ABFS83_08G009800 [Erythranthe nasuta]
MDFDTVHRDNLGLYSKVFEEIPYIPQIMDNYDCGGGGGGSGGAFSSSPPSSHGSSGRVMGGSSSSWNPGPGFYAPNTSSFYDPFDPFQPSSFGKLMMNTSQEFSSPFPAQDNNININNSHVRKTFLDDYDCSRASFQTVDQFHQMNVMSYLQNNDGKYFDNKDSCLVVSGGDVDNDDNADVDDASQKMNTIINNDVNNNNKNIIMQQAKRKRVVDKKSEIVKGQWSPEEDGLLVELVEKHGVRKWSTIAQMLPGRIGKQCRERWHNHLKPNIKKDRWSEEEDSILIEAHRQLGNKWAEIARSLPGRSENTIKNHWNATKRRQLSSRKNSNSKTNSPLQNYIKTVIATNTTSDDKGNLDISSSSSSVSVSASPDGMVNPKPVDKNCSKAMKFENAPAIINNNAEESFKLLPMMETAAQMHVATQFDLVKEMDFMEMLSSYNEYYM